MTILRRFSGLNEMIFERHGVQMVGIVIVMTMKNKNLRN